MSRGIAFCCLSFVTSRGIVLHCAALHCDACCTVMQCDVAALAPRTDFRFLQIILGHSFLLVNLAGGWELGAWRLAAGGGG